VTYRGMPAPARIALGAALVLGVGAVLGLTLPSALASIAGVAVDTPAKIPWLTSRVTAFLAYFAITASVVYGLLLSTKVLDAIAHRPVSFALHQDLAAVGLGLAAIHGALLTLDQTIHFSVADLLVPFASPYRPIAVGVGQLAFSIVALVTLSFYARRRIGQRTWRLIHYLTFVAFVGSAAHGIAAGTDSSQPWAFWTYAGSAAIVVFLTAYRITVGVTAARDRRAVEQADRTPTPRIAPLTLRRPT
jgi:sulfoxide reductase heme-binding subunit YedZ